MAKIYDETIQSTNEFLNNFATFYKLRNPVADFISPPFKVKLQAGKYLEYNKSLFRIYDDKIIGDEIAKQIQWDVDESTYACEEYAMSKFVSDKKKAQAEKPINYDKDAVKFLKRFHAQAREYRINQIAGNAAIVTQTANAASAWATAAGTPVTDILLGKSTVENATTGYEPNKILIPTQVALQMIQTTEWRDYFKYTSNGFTSGLFDAIAGIRHLGLEPMTTSLHGLTEGKCTASDPQSEAMWDDNVLIFYSEPVPTLETRTFMFSPFVVMNKIFTTPEPRRRGVYHDIYSDIDELLVDASCAYLITNTL